MKPHWITLNTFCHPVKRLSNRVLLMYHCHVFVQVLKILRFPWIKFAVHSSSYIAFLVMIVFHTTDATTKANQHTTLGASTSYI